MRRKLSILTIALTTFLSTYAFNGWLLDAHISSSCAQMQQLSEHQVVRLWQPWCRTGERSWELASVLEDVVRTVQE